MDKKKLKKSLLYSLEYKAEPIAMLVYLEKKYKKVDTLELAKLYNKKCFGLYDQIDNLKDEIDTYKQIIEHLRQEIVNQEPSLLYPKSKTKATNQEESTIISSNDISSPGSITEAIREQYESKEKDYLNYIQSLKHEIASLKEENLELKQRLTKYTNESKNNEEQIKQLRLSRVKSKNISEFKVIEIKEQLDQVLLENVFLMYLLDRSLNYEKILRHLNNNFNFYFKLFVCDKKDMNIYSSILHDFIYRIHKKVNIEALSEEIFLSNSITKGEDYNIRFTQSKFLSSGFIDEDVIMKLNSRVSDYRKESIDEITQLLKNCQEKINNEPSLEALRRFEVTSVYTISSKGKLKIDCNKLTNDTALFLINTLRFSTDELVTIEFNGDLRDQETNIEGYIKILYNLKTYFGDKITLLILNNITNIKPEFITQCFNLLFEYLPKLIKVMIVKCNLTDEQFSKFSFEKNNLKEIDLSYNKLERLDHFTMKQCNNVIFKGNPLKFKSGDSLIQFTKLDLSEIDFSVEVINQFNNWMKESTVTWLNLSHIKINQEIGILLGNTLEHLTKLKVIYLNNIGLTEECAPLVLQHLNKLTIEEIYLNDNKLGEIGSLIVVGLLRNNRSIRKIELARCNIGPISIKPLVQQIMKSASIKEVNFEGNNFDKEEIQDLSEKITVII